jgi:predicted nucleotidyltransferase
MAADQGSPHTSVASQSLPPEVRQRLTGYHKELLSIFGPALQSVVLYGSLARGEYLDDRSNLNVLLILGSIELSALRQYGRAHRRWSKEGIVVPLMLTPEELHATAQVFPLEYVEMLDPHVLLAGKDPFEDLPLDRSRLLLQCKQEVQGNLIRLRQRLVEGGATSEAMAMLLPLSITALLPCLRGLLRVFDRTPYLGTDALLKRVEADFQIDLTACKEVWQLKRALITTGSAEVPRLCERYMTALARLNEKVAALKEPSA